MYFLVKVNVGIYALALDLIVISSLLSWNLHSIYPKLLLEYTCMPTILWESNFMAGKFHIICRMHKSRKKIKVHGDFAHSVYGQIRIFKEKLEVQCVQEQNDKTWLQRISNLFTEQWGYSTQSVIYSWRFLFCGICTLHTQTCQTMLG